MIKKILPLIFIFALWPLPGRAFSVSPPKVRLTIAPGQSKIIPFTIINNETKTQAFTVSVAGVEQNEAAGTLKFVAGREAAESWLAIATSSLSLAPGKSATIETRLAVPDAARPGSRLIAVLVSSLPTESAGVGLSGQVAALVNFDVAGTVTESLDIESWRGRFAFGRLAPDLQLKNTGTQIIPLSGRLTVYDWRSKKIYDEPVTLGDPLLPGAYRRVALSGPELKPGFYRTEIEVRYGRSQTSARSLAPAWNPFWLPYALLAAASAILIATFVWRKREVFNG